MHETTSDRKDARPPAVELMRHLGLEPDPWQLEVLEGGHQRLKASWHICFCMAVPLISVSTMSSPCLKWKASSMLMRFIVRTYGA